MIPVVTKSRKIFIFSFILGLSIQSLFAQESILKGFAETRKTRKICFYPSTLRMINISQDEAYNDLIEPVEKLLVYVLDSATSAEKSYQETLKQYRDEGFDEYAYITGGDYDVYIMGMEDATPQWIGVINQNEQAFAFYLQGYVNWQKILSMGNTLEDNEILQLLNLTGNSSE